MLVLLSLALWIIVVAAFPAFGEPEQIGMDSLKQSIERQPDDTNKVRNLCALAKKLARSSPRESLEFAEKALQLAKKFQSPIHELEALYAIGNAEYRNDHLIPALEYCLKAYQIAIQLNHTERMATILNRLGTIYRKQKNYPKAKESLTKANELYTSIRDDEGVSATLVNLGDIAATLGHDHESLALYKKALHIDIKIGDTAAIIMDLSNVGGRLRKLQRYDEGRDYLSKAQTMLEGNDDIVSEANILDEFSLLEQEAGNISKAIEYSKKLEALAKLHGLTTRLILAYRGLAELHALQKNFYLAYTYQEKLTQLNDTLYNKENSLKIAAIQKSFELQQQQFRIQLLENTLVQQQQLRNTLIALLVLAGFTVVTLLYIYHQRKKFIKTLELQKMMIETQSIEIQTMNTSLQEQNLHLQQQQTVIQQTNNDLQQTNVTLEHLVYEKNEFLGIAAHDLKNPLTHIVHVSTFLEKHIQRLDTSEVLPQLRSVTNVAAKMNEIITNLLELHALESGKQTVNITDVNFLTILRQIEEFNALKASQKDIHLHFIHQSPNDILLMKTDKTAMQSIIDNLLSNALKFSSPGTSVKVVSTQTKRGVRVEVHDEGPGIQESERKLLFAKFAKLSNKPTSGENSTGLGLCIVKQFVDTLNGQIWHEHGKTRGSVFVVEIPSIFTP